MSENYDIRIPKEVGAETLALHPAIQTPWNKLISFHDSYHYAARHNAAVASSFMQVMRIIEPDYGTRSRKMNEINHKAYFEYFNLPEYQEMFRERHCVPPFLKGTVVGALTGDQGDEGNVMPGRVNDYGTYRFEKELDACPWDIVGSELCRSTVDYFQACCEPFGDPKMELCMVEAKGCGDLHCRIVAENREKYPMPPRTDISESFGPIATADQIKFTPEEKMVKEPQFFRPECGFKYRLGFNAEWTADDDYPLAVMPLGSNNIIPTIEALEPDNKKVEHITKCVFEAAGKMAFAEFAAIKGVRDWLGVPGDINDGRVMGSLIEVVLQALVCDYTIMTFTNKEVIYDIDRNGLERSFPLLITAYLSMWNGMVKTLVNTQWFVWEETDDVPENTLRLKIGKKIDKYA